MTLEKKDGISGSLIGIGSVTIAIIFLLAMLKSKELSLTNDFLYDGLVFSNLAAATVDLKEYGSTNKIVNNHFDKSFNEYQNALKENLKLDNDFVPIDSNNSMIAGKVTVEIFTIYNVDGNDIHMIKRQSNGNIIKQTYHNELGSMYTPDGVLIKSTTVYSRIGMELKGYMNSSFYFYKDNSVDITDKD